jgi:hypothetical protein
MLTGIVFGVIGVQLYSIPFIGSTLVAAAFPLVRTPCASTCHCVVN